MEQVVINAFVQSVIELLGIPLMITAIGVLWVLGVKFYKQGKAAEPELFAELEWAAAQVVKAAEQSGLAGLINDKKKYAINALEKMLEAKGWNIDLDVIDAAIEAAVKDLKDGKEPETE